MAASTYFDQVQQLYIAYFGRPADPTGQAHWAGVIDAAKGDISAVLTGFSASDESQALFGNRSTIDKVTAIYQNVFGRSPEPAGLAYWVAKIDSGEVTQAQASWTIQQNAGPGDAAAVQNKLTAAKAFTAEIDTAAEIQGYQGNASAASARDFLQTVTSDNATATAAVTGAAAAVAAAIANGGATFTLTNNVDVATAHIFNAPQVYTPGGNDFINSLQNDDVLTGTAATDDVLNVTLGNSNDNGSNVILPTLNGIEIINARFDTTNSNAVLDLQDSTGVKQINVTRIADGQNATVKNIADAGANTLTVTNTQSPAGSVNFTYLESALAGTTDKADVTVSNVNINDLVVQAAGTTPAEGFETINLKSTGSANKVDTLIAEDLQTLNITGDKNLTLGGRTNTTGAQGVEAVGYSAGLGNVAGSLTVVDASTFTGNLDYTIGAEIGAGLDNTSGVNVELSVTGGKGDDIFRVTGVEIGGVAGNTDKINGGEGKNTLVVVGGATITAAATNPVANITNIQALEVRTGHDVDALAETATINADAFDKLESIYVRNEGQQNLGAGNVSTPEVSTVILNNLTSAQAAGLTVAHGTTGNNGLAQNNVTATLKTATGATDTVGVTLVDGVNTDKRFNLNLTAGEATKAGRVENITLTDSDTESNTVHLVNAAQHTGTVTLTGGKAGQFLNLDSDAAGGQTGGLYNYLTTGDQEDLNAARSTLNNIVNVGAAAQDRLVAATIDASAFVGNAVVRVSTAFEADASKETATGGQKITMGTGNDTVIFDKINDTRAGLTISDTVAGGAGNDTLVIDGEGVNISLGASEWTNVSGFETIRLVGNNEAGTLVAGNGFQEVNAYNLTLTNELIANNGVNNVINIVNDNDLHNGIVNGNAVADLTGAAAAGVYTNTGVTIDARTLTSTNSFTYKGQEGEFRTSDRFILSDANINGKAVIDGGAALDNGTNAANNNGNLDVLEVRNAAVVTVGDLAGISNVSNLEFTNDTAAVQSSVLELNNTVVDALVNSSKAAVASTGVETLNISAIDNALVANAFTQLNIDASQVTSNAFALNITLGAGADVVIGSAGNDIINAGRGADVLTGGAGADKFVIGLGDSGLTVATADRITDFSGVTAGQLDKLALGVAGDVTNFTFQGAAGVDYNDVLTAANVALNNVGGAQQYYVGNDGTDTYVFVNDGAAVGADQVIILSGLVNVVASDIVAA